MNLVKDGQVISLDNESHISAFLASGWVEAPASSQRPAEEEPVAVAEKKPAGRKKQEK